MGSLVQCRIFIYRLGFKHGTKKFTDWYGSSVWWYYSGAVNLVLSTQQQWSRIARGYTGSRILYIVPVALKLVPGLMGKSKDEPFTAIQETDKKKVFNKFGWILYDFLSGWLWRKAAYQHCELNLGWNNHQCICCPLLSMGFLILWWGVSEEQYLCLWACCWSRSLFF